MLFFYDRGGGYIFLEKVMRNIKDVKYELEWAIGRLEQYARLVEFLSHEHSCLIKEQKDQEKLAEIEAKNIIERMMKWLNLL